MIRVGNCEYGRGMFATKKIRKGTVVLRNRVIRVKKNAVPEYVFKYTVHEDCICLGDGELFNHSGSANVDYELVWYKKEYWMAFIANRKIKKGEQLFIDYRQDDPLVDLKVYGIKE